MAKYYKENDEYQEEVIVSCLDALYRVLEHHYKYFLMYEHLASLLKTTTSLIVIKKTLQCALQALQINSNVKTYYRELGWPAAQR